jgi:hypothetical protein
LTYFLMYSLSTSSLMPVLSTTLSILSSIQTSGIKTI